MFFASRSTLCPPPVFCSGRVIATPRHGRGRCLDLLQESLERFKHLGAAGPGRTPGRGFIGQYLFGFRRTSSNDKRESPDGRRLAADSSGVWPYEASKRGLARPRRTQAKNWGWAIRCTWLSTRCLFDIVSRLWMGCDMDWIPRKVDERHL
jgi:hypothetical protein